MAILGVVVVVELAYAHNFGPQKAAIAKFVSSQLGGAAIASWGLGFAFIAVGLFAITYGRRRFKSLEPKPHLAQGSTP